MNSTSSVTILISLCSFAGLVLSIYLRLVTEGTPFEILLPEKYIDESWLIERTLLFLPVIYYSRLFALSIATVCNEKKSRLNVFTRYLGLATICFCAFPFPEAANDGLILSFGAVFILSTIYNLAHQVSLPLNRHYALGRSKMLLTTIIVLIISFFCLSFIHNLFISSRVGFGDSTCQIKQSELLSRGYFKIPLEEFNDKIHLPGCMVVKNGYVFSRWLPGHAIIMTIANSVVAVKNIGAIIGSVLISALYLLLLINGASLLASLSVAIIFMLSPATMLIFVGTFSQLSMCIALLLWVGAVCSIERKQKLFLPSLLIIVSISFGILNRPLSTLGMLIFPYIFLFKAAFKTAGWERKILLLSTFGSFLGVGLLAAYNWYLTGSPLLTGYEIVFGSGHRPGFHIDPSGTPFTFTDGIHALWLNLATINRQLFGMPIPSLCLVGIGLIFGSFTLFELLLLLASLGIGLIHITYWAFPTVQYGPRFIFETIPILIILGVKGIQYIIGVSYGIYEKSPRLSLCFLVSLALCLIAFYILMVHSIYQLYSVHAVNSPHRKHSNLFLIKKPPLPTTLSK